MPPKLWLGLCDYAHSESGTHVTVGKATIIFEIHSLGFKKEGISFHYIEFSMAKIVFEEDAEIIVPESTKKPENNDIFDESSDDEAPEAISTSKAKESLISKEQAEREAAAK
jgi:hypothetical protein